MTSAFPLPTLGSRLRLELRGIPLVPESCRTALELLHMPPEPGALLRLCIPAIVMALPLPAQSLHAQVRRELSFQPGCPNCTITVKKVLTLGDEDGPGSFATRPYSIAQDRRGQFYVVTPETGNEPPFVFNARGRYLQRVGSVGDGPGEFRSPGVVLAVRDTLYIFDATGRISILSDSLGLVRTIAGPPRAMAAHRFDNGTIVVNALVRDANRIGYVQHYLDANGNYLDSADIDTLAFNPRNTTARVRRFASGSGDRLWSARYTHRYTLSSWTARGVLVKELTGSPDWFPPFINTWNPTPTRTPMPYVMGVWEDERGYVWTIALVGAGDWQRGLGSKVQLEGQEVYLAADYQLLYDTVIEVVDPIAGRLVTHRRWPGTLDVVIRPGLVAGVRESGEGAVTAEVYRVELIAP